MTLTLTFRDCGFAGRETAWLGEWLLGCVEPPGQRGMKALWSFYPESRRRVVNQPAPSLEHARGYVASEVNAMLRAMGVLARGDAGVVVVVVPAEREWVGGRRSRSAVKK